MGTEQVYAKYIELVRAVNESKTSLDHVAAWNRHRGFIVCLEAIGWSDASIGRLIMHGDQHYIDQGIDRSMCGGVWADWKPEAVPHA